MKSGAEPVDRPVLHGFGFQISPGEVVPVSFVRELPGYFAFDRLYVAPSESWTRRGFGLLLDRVEHTHNRELPALRGVPLEWFGFERGVDGLPGQPVPFPALQVGERVTLYFSSSVVDAQARLDVRGLLAGTEVFQP